MERQRERLHAAVDWWEDEHGAVAKEELAEAEAERREIERLAAVALRQPGRVTIFTSDEDDIRQLCEDRVVAVKL